MSLAMTLDARNSEDDIPLLTTIVQKFCRTLQRSDSGFYEIRVAIRGFGALSRACGQLLEETFLNEILTLVLQRIRYADYKDDGQKSKKLLEHLPDYVYALSEIMTNMKRLTAIQLTYLENIIVELMRDFYYLSQVHHELVIVSVLNTLSNVQKFGENVYNDFLERVVFQGVVWACDKCLVYDTEWTEGRDWKENVTYRSYLPLWHGLVADNKPNLKFDRPKMAKKLMDILLSTLFQIIGKLNFTTRKRTYKDEDGADQEFNFCDPNIDLVPVKPQDFHIFVNVVYLYVEILKELSLETKKDVVLPWLGHACDELIQNIIKYPLISGFVKLLEVVVKIGTETGHFAQFKDSNLDPGQRTLRLTLSAFLTQIIEKITQITAELQLSYLKLIFVYPPTLLMEHVSKVAHVYVIAFEFGTNLAVLWIASMALRSLEELVEEVGEDKRKGLLKRVMPSLELFLSGSGDATLSNIKMEVTKPGARKRKYDVPEGSETEPTKFKKRVLLFMSESLRA